MAIILLIRIKQIIKICTIFALSYRANNIWRTHCRGVSLIEHLMDINGGARYHATCLTTHASVRPSLSVLPYHLYFSLSNVYSILINHLSTASGQICTTSETLKLLRSNHLERTYKEMKYRVASLLSQNAKNERWHIF